MLNSLNSLNSTSNLPTKKLEILPIDIFFITKNANKVQEMQKAKKCK